MGRFLIINADKRSRSDEDTNLLPASKKPHTCAKQRNTAVRVAEFGNKLSYADGGKLFCCPCNLVVDRFQKNTVSRHFKSKVITLFKLSVRLLKSEDC